MKSYAVISLFAALAAAQAATHTVTVGGVQPAADATSSPKPNLVYTPESISAAVGDVVEFHFLQTNHTVTQSSFANPCVKAVGGM